MNEQQKIKLLFNRLLHERSYFFPQKGPLDITCQKGVYIIFNPKGKPSHVGNTPRGERGLCQRLNNHIYWCSSFSKKFLKPQGLSVRNEYSFKFLKISSARDRALLEALAIGLLCPEHIGTHEKAEIKE